MPHVFPQILLLGELLAKRNKIRLHDDVVESHRMCLDGVIVAV